MQIDPFIRLGAHSQMRPLWNLAQQQVPLQLSQEQWKGVELSYEHLHHLLRSGQTVYGTTTHFGAQLTRSRELEMSQHQKELVRFLTVATGPLLPSGVVRRAIKLQIMKMAQGYSGLKPQTLERLLDLSNAMEMPAVPRHGSLGASGDLVPMAQAIGSIFRDYEPGPRDGLALVNTNAMMASLAIQAWGELAYLWQTALEISAKIWGSVGASRESLELMLKEPIRSQRPQQGLVSEWFLAELESVGIESTGLLQPRYSLRCTPQILGVTYRQMQQAQSWILEEALALADNPVIFEEGAWHGGLFYASGLASGADLIQDVIAKMAEWLDRQVLLLMDPELSGGLPHNLEVEGKSHCKGLHQLISALCQRLRALSQPCRLMSFSCESNNQDLVPCAMEGWNLVMDQLEIFKELLLAARFCAERAFQIRSQRFVPALESWREGALK